MTFIAAVIDHKNMMMTYANAGHVFPILIPQIDDDERLKTREMKHKRVPLTHIIGHKSSSIIGIDLNSKFTDNEIDLFEGDKLIFYTDGITESANAKGKMLGVRGLFKIIQKVEDPSCISLKKQIISNVKEYNAKGEEFEDDVTLVVLELNKFEY